MQKHCRDYTFTVLVHCKVRVAALWLLNTTPSLNLGWQKPWLKTSSQDTPSISGQKEGKCDCIFHQQFNPKRSCLWANTTAAGSHPRVKELHPQNQNRKLEIGVIKLMPYPRVHWILLQCSCASPSFSHITQSPEFLKAIYSYAIMNSIQPTEREKSVAVLLCYGEAGNK